MKSITTKIIYSAVIATSLILSSPCKAQNPEEMIIAELVTCITNFNDRRTYVEFIDKMISLVKQHREYLEKYFAQNHPSLNVNGFLNALHAARKSTNALSAGAALRNYYELLPKHVTLAALMNGINRRMKEDFKKN